MSGAACGARLRASAAGGCGPHDSRSRTTATTANCSQTPRQTGISNWRQNKLGSGVVVVQTRIRIANTDFSRASRNPALRRLANTRPAGFGTRTFAPPLSKPGDCELKTQNDKKPAQKPPQKQTIPLTLLRHYAASGLLNLLTTLTKAVTPVTPGGVADSEDKTKIINTKNSSGTTAKRRAAEPQRIIRMDGINGIRKKRGLPKGTRARQKQ